MKGLNDRESKEEKRYMVHNRKPGRARWWKQKSNRKNRRWGTRVNRQRIEDINSLHE